MHATLECTACHLNNKFKGTPAACFACHQADFTGTNNPPHAQTGMPHDCGICHSTTDWLNAKFNHNTYTNYPLTGMHVAVPCASVPREQPVCDHADRLLLLPQGGLRLDDQSQSRRVGVPDQLRPVPHNKRVESGVVRSLEDGISADRRAHLDVLRAVPRQQQLHDAADGLLRVPQGRLQWHHEPQPPAAGFPTNCLLCHTTTSWTDCHLQPLQQRFRSPARTPLFPALNAT